MRVPAKLAVVAWCAALLACSSGAERAIRVTVMVRSPVDDVCITARDEDTQPTPTVMSFAYDASALPMPATLTFVAGPSFTGPAEITARGLTAGMFVGGAMVTTALSTHTTTEATLPVERCRARAAAGFGTRPAGTFAVLRDPPRLLAADYDGDGRDELLAVAEDGTLASLDAENVDRGSHRESSLRATDGVLVGAGDLDRDCRVDVLTVAGSGVLVVKSPMGDSPPPVGTSAPHDAAIGRVGRMNPLRLFVAGATGLAMVPPPGGTGSLAMLSTTPVDHVVSWDSDGDGGSEILATGAMGVLAFHTVSGVETPMLTTPLPLGFSMFQGPIAIGDVDDDGDVDVVIVSTTALHVARRGAASFTDASGTTATVLDMPVVRVAVADVDGDCADDVIAISASGIVSVFSVKAAGGLMSLGTMAGALDFAVGDYDGDGAREIALIGTGGRVTLWQP